MAQLSDQSDFLKTALRLPRGLHASIQEAAHANGRSMNAEIIERLRQSFEPAQARVSVPGPLGAPAVVAVHHPLPPAQVVGVESLPPTSIGAPTVSTTELADVAHDLKDTAEILGEALKIIFRPLPPGTPVSSDPLVLVRKLMEVTDREPRERTSLSKHTKR